MKKLNATYINEMIEQSSNEILCEENYIRFRDDTISTIKNTEKLFAAEAKSFTGRLKKAKTVGDLVTCIEEFSAFLEKPGNVFSGSLIGLKQIKNKIADLVIPPNPFS